MVPAYPKEGLFELCAEDIFEEAKLRYEEFFEEQTSIEAFRISITLYHLLEWVVPGANSKSTVSSIRQKTSCGQISAEEQLILDIHDYKYYEVLRSLADNSKHFELTRSDAYEKDEVFGLMSGHSVVGERLGQRNLTVNFEGQNIWLRKLFSDVLCIYGAYFNTRAL